MSLCLNRGNDLATVLFSAICKRLLSNSTSLLQRYNNYTKYKSPYWNNLHKTVQSIMIIAKFNVYLQQNSVNL